MNPSHWQNCSQVFHDRAAEYDQWFEDSLLFDVELTALLELQTSFAAPKMEIGVGPGRFAEALDISFGLDPAFAPLLLSRRRKIAVMRGIGEELPVRSDCMASMYLLFTFCFLQQPRLVLAECYRVLTGGGHLVLGMVPVSGPWGKALLAKKEKNNPFYKHASFYEAEQALHWMQEAGFKIVECRSSLFQEPGDLAEGERSREGLDGQAGFCLLVGEK